jgi:hypothetical protein
VRRSVLAGLAALAAISFGLVAVEPARSAVVVSRFAITPSTTQAGGHPTLDMVVEFAPATSEVGSIVLHLPAGLTTNARAAPFCSSSRLLSDLCPLNTRVGFVTLAGEALGFEAEARRNIYNLRLTGAERLRLGVPIFGSFSRGGIALTLPVTARSNDGGLDLAIAGPPREVGGYAIKIKRVGFQVRGLLRRKVKRVVRRRALVTNPRVCGPATSTLEITTNEVPPATSVQTSTFAITGC